MLNIHENIKNKLTYFYQINKIPNIIFHGANGSGKRTVVNDFINLIYSKDKDKIKNMVMYVNCSHGKGIRFIRDELKLFAKTNINHNNGNNFKSIILLNADKLTIDAQSALRRCIELFSHNTRFFIIVENKHTLMKPILSRFCEIYIPEPDINNKLINLYNYNLNKINFGLKDINNKHIEILKKELNYLQIQEITNTLLIKLSLDLYEKGFSALNLIHLLENTTYFHKFIDQEKTYELLICFSKIRKEIRNEKLLIFFVLNFIFISSDINLENISFM